ncbi:DEAD/DEAH box helicase [Conyzicola nivalis]|uniref:Helicase n=1 Tax=Conyzicola nivalis TaxID=1477021 RepID=A0A916SD30_9MICO|nr:DEAD/DEAH box helicase [Conyzicola nivalis]GGA93472.1 helicase [Conyzicola nivalis]
MSELLPTRLTQRIRASLVDYLTTTFALSDDDAQRELERFLVHETEGIFRGPFVRTRLPYGPAAAGWERALEWYPREFTPYGHQAKAFRRLSSAASVNARPQPTLVTTGTGSGKTEAFLVPIIDHVLRARRENITGVKALILYPMNALANDQAKRLTELLTSDPRLSGVTAALYTGEQSEKRTRVSEKGLITDRTVIRQSAPDILLTNYKMLDQLLLRHEDAKLWSASATSLQYVVLDEFHIYDGAQGTDVAMLLRRLGATLKSYWSDDSPVTRSDWSRPLGRATPVATSATLGDGGDPGAMLAFARTVFGDEFDATSVVTEARVTVDEWARSEVETTPDVTVDLLVGINDAVDRLGDGADASHIASEVLKQLWGAEVIVGDSSLSLMRYSTRHPLIRTIVRATKDAVGIDDLARTVFEGTGASAAPADVRVDAVVNLVAMLSHVRKVCGRAAVGIDVHLWVRELSRIDRAAAAQPAFRWTDDGVTLGHDAIDVTDSGAFDAYPAIYCRHCGRSGWGVVLAATGADLDADDSDIRRRHLVGDDRFRPLIFAPKEADYVYFEQRDRQIEGLRWLHTRNRQLVAALPADGDADFDAGYVLPVLTHVGLDAGERSKDDWCPSCLKADGIRFLGSAIATLLSVTLSSMFGESSIDVGEKKALVFTDSVQDAAHRAGFVQARSHVLTLRAALRSALGNASVSLDQLVDGAMRDAGVDRFARYRLVPPDLTGNDLFREYWSPAGDHAARRSVTAVRNRLLFDAVLEFGLQSRVGRTLELTGSVTAEVDGGPAAALAAIARNVWLEYDQGDLLGGAEIAAPTSAAGALWVRGVLERMREQGAIQHPWLDSYVKEDGNRYRIWGGRNRAVGVPAFPSGRPAPAFPRVGVKTAVRRDNLDNVSSSQGWYALWAAKCLSGLTASEGAKLARMLFVELDKRDVIGSVKTDSAADVYFLRSDQIVLAQAHSDELDSGRLQLRCDVCDNLVPGSASVIDQLADGPCTVSRCPGRLKRRAGKGGFYRGLYASSDMRRVVAREHTSLLESATRLQYETAFKSRTAEPDAPNVLVATPTLEMGIDIGDLSAVFLASLPRTVASYVQRVGRAGRLTGNSLSITYVTGRGENLPRVGDPLSVINGSVQPPATYLSAEEILRRQFLAFLGDRIARDPLADHPKTAQGALGGIGEGTYLGRVATSATHDALRTFLNSFDGVSDEVVGRIEGWISRGESDVSELDRFLARAAARWHATVDELGFRKAKLVEIIPELELKALSPAATDDDKRAERSARAALRMTEGQLGRLKGEYWISVLEEYGIYPNYTLLDDSVNLDVAMSWFDPETQKWESDTMNYQRGSASALTEFAPGATFYSRGFVVKVDAVDLGQEPTVTTPWTYCAACGFARAELPGMVALTACPRCGSGSIADVKQRLDTVQMSGVSAQIRRDDALINDSRDERERTRFTVLTAADINDSNVKAQWFVDGYDFGMRHLSDVDIRWINLGPAGKQAISRALAGHEVMSPLFRVCDTCGKLDESSKSNGRDEHRPWCPRRDDHDEHTRSVALMRHLHTQGVVVRLPTVLKYDKFAVPSLSAALLLGLRELMGGAPDHIQIAQITEPLGGAGEVADALLLHDVVPGGTGYLAELARPARVWALLHAAWERVRDCPCREEERLACHRCLLPFAAPWQTGEVARETAEVLLRRILASGGDEVPDVAPSAHGWKLLDAPPAPVIDESHLEARFREALSARLSAVGATVKETPTALGNQLTVTLPGDSRLWWLEPQVHLGATVPDFVLRCSDTTIPRVAIYTDGFTFHATVAHNRIADDAHKRSVLRAQGYAVLAVSWNDLTMDSVADPWWYSQAAVQNALTQNVNLSAGVVDASRGGPLTMLIRWMQTPEPDRWRQFGDAVPLLLAAAPLGETPVGISASELAAFQVLGTVQSGTGAFGLTVDAGPHVSFVALLSHSSGALVTDVGLVLDNRTGTMVEPTFSESWRRWLTLSNLMFARQAPFAIAGVSSIEKNLVAGDPAAVSFSPVWAGLLEMAASDEERELLRELVDANIETPELGVEVGDGIPVSIAWPAHKIAVELGLESRDIEDLRTTGWMVVPAIVHDIVAALEGSR